MLQLRYKNTVYHDDFAAMSVQCTKHLNSKYVVTIPQA
jgi:hypothetical protein